ncbi:hypothetical protein K1719_011110 [Acacia pycnantha]|nr:hypothetical protein K1719_011110 [Acacia pycnantha]
MVYETNTSGFRWDPDTKCVTADKEVWDEYIKTHSRAAQFCTKSFPNFESLTMEEAARWKRDNEAKEANKRKCAEKRKPAATVSKKRKGQTEVDGDSLSESSDHGSSESNHKEEDNGGEGKRRAKLYKKLKKVHRRPNGVPEAKTKFNQSKLEDHDISFKEDQGSQDSTHEETGSSMHVDEVNSDDKLAHSEDDSFSELSDGTPSDKPVEGYDGLY